MTIKKTVTADMGLLDMINDIGLILLMIVCADILLATTILLFGGSIAKAILPVAALIVLVLFYFVQKGQGKQKDLFIEIIVISAFLMIGIAVCGRMFNSDFDGNAYHKAAIGYLKNGWNPMQGSADIFCKRYFNTEEIVSHAIWVDHYGKATWIFASCIYAITGNIECGKVYNMIGIVCVFSMLLPYLVQKGVSIKQAAIIAFLTAFNPITIVQSFSYYVDGFLLSMFLVLVIGLTRLSDDGDKSLDLKVYLSIFCSMVVLGNIKFTGLFYGGVFCAVYFFAFIVIPKYKERSKRGYIVKDFLFFFMTAVTTIVWAGYPTYILNLIQHKNPLYPLIGPDAVDIMTTNSPSGFHGRSSLYKLFYSIFGEGCNLSYDNEHKLPCIKFPFTFTMSELDRTAPVDMRISGYGIWFSGILVISLAVLIIGLIRSYKKDRKRFFYLAVNLSLISILMLTVSDSWWARYSPHLYLIVVFAMIMMADLKEKRIYTVIRGAFIISILMNNLWFMNRVEYTYKMSQGIRGQLGYINTEMGQIDVGFYSPFAGNLFNLEDAGIRFDIDPGLNEKNAESAFYGLYFREQ